MNSYTKKLANTFGYSAFDEEEQERRSLLVFLVVLTCLGGLFYSLIFLSLGVKHTILAILFYIFFSALNLIYFYFTKNYGNFRNAQLIGILFFPFMTHIANGGYEQNSAVVLPAMLSPLGALMFHRPSIAKRFFYGFMGILLAASLIDYFFDTPNVAISNEVKLGFYFFNLGSAAAISFFLLHKFVKDNDEIKSLLKVKNQELANEKLRVEEALQELKNTQKQLVHSEKMASLGELTAGIAHEIQNPLNFVNNFSEVGVEFLEDLIEELGQKNYDEVEAIAQDLKINLEKINHHGKRADGIVKAMLQHSNSSSGQKMPLNLNALCDEYLRLAYHGLRAKDKSFNATMDTAFDPELPLIEAVAQDMGRVILNIITNAFHAVSDRSRKEGGSYTPKVTVGTLRGNKVVEIYIRDNGSGIPEQIKQKIFQPFFTTKPTGQGTGLGLSLAFDIVKSHGGQIRIDTKEGEGSTFYIELPAKAQPQKTNL
jgi:two-component system NtrC family sensor kinase